MPYAPSLVRATRTVARAASVLGLLLVLCFVGGVFCVVCCFRFWSRGRAVLRPFPRGGWRCPLLLSVAGGGGSVAVAVPCCASLVAVVGCSVAVVGFAAVLRSAVRFAVACSPLVSRPCLVAGFAVRPRRWLWSSVAVVVPGAACVVVASVACCLAVAG